MPNSPVWYEADDATLLSAPALTCSVPPGPAQEWHLNNPATSSATLTNLRVFVEAKISGATDYETAGLPILDQRWTVAEVLGSGVGPVRIGGGRWIDLPDLAPGETAALSVYLDPPLSTQGATFDIHVAVTYASALAIGAGISETTADGILSGLGDATSYELVRGGAITEAGTPDSTVLVPYFAWVEGGLPYAFPAAAVTISAVDGAAATLGSGEEYIAALVALGGTIGQVKGAKAATGTAIRPTLPARSQILAYVRRDLSAVITNGDITEAWLLGRFAIASAGLVVFYGPGRARVDNMLIVTSGRLQVTVPASATRRHWLGRNGDVILTATTDPNPDARALALADITTDGSGVTAIADLRPVVHLRPARVELRRIGAAGTGAVSPPGYVDGSRPQLLDPGAPLSIALGDMGTLPTLGAERVDLRVSVAGGSYASLFASTADMPSVPYSATDPTATASSPASLIIAPGSRYRLEVDIAPTATAPPNDLVGVLNGALG